MTLGFIIDISQTADTSVCVLPGIQGLTWASPPLPVAGAMDQACGQPDKLESHVNVHINVGRRAHSSGHG